MNDTETGKQVLSNKSLVFISIFMTVWVFSFIYNVIRILKKFHGDLKPNHIFIMNMLLSISLKCLYLVIVYIHRMLTSSAFCPHYFFGLIIFTSNNLDIIIMQMDRFVAVFWSLLYPGIATNSKALLICCSSKILSTVLALAVLFLDKECLKCMKITPLLFTRPSNILLISGTQLCSTVVVAVVSSYLGYKMVKIRKTVMPTATLGRMQPQVEVEGRRIQVRRIDDQPNMFYSLDLPGREREQTIQTGENIVTDSTTNTIFMMAKTALSINYIVIFNCLVITPTSIMSMVFWNCDHTGGRCDLFLLFNRIMVIPRHLTLFSLFFIIFYKLKKSECV